MSKTRIYPILLLSSIMLIIIGCAQKKTLTPAEIKKAYMQNIYQELKQEISNEAEVTIIEDSIKVIFKNGVLFKVDDHVVMPELHECFARFANVLNKFTNTNILITGHTDNTGSVKHNKELSQNRADNAKNLLESFNVLESRMYTWGQGPLEPVDTNETQEGRTRNRRVEFVILYNVRL